MTSKRVVGIVLTSAVVAGYTGAAAWSAWAQPSVELATGYGEGDGLTRYVATAAPSDAGVLAALDTVPGVASAQWVADGRVLVAADGVTPDRLEAVPGVSDVAPSTSVPVFGTVTDPYFAQYGWNLENTGMNAYQEAAVADADVDATTGWDTGTGVGRIVAVVDSGFDSDHPDLAGALWTNPDERCGTTDTDGNGLAGDCHGWNFYANNADVDNGSLGSHGASVSGVVGARANNGVGSAGVAPGVSIMPLVAGGGSTVDIYLCAAAIRYAVDHGADVINASWGGAISGPPLTALRSAIAYAEAHGVLVVAAAGNDSGNRDTTPVYPASLTEANVVTVGSSTAADTIAGHSGYGATSVDLFAPGSRVATTWNDGGMRLVSGTSFAAPHVAAAAALYRAVLPTASAAELKQALLADVDRVPAFSGRSVTGGRLSMGRIAEDAADPVRYAFTSMTARAGTVRPTVGISAPAVGGRYTVDVGLGMEHEGEVWALSGKTVTLDGVPVLTDDAGDARFDLGAIDDFDGIGLSPAVDLAAGRYVLTVQLHRDGEPLGRMHAAPLLVSPSETPGTPAPGGSSPDDGASGGTTPPGATPPGGTPPRGTPPPVSTPGGTAPSAPAPSAPGTPTPGTPAPGGTTPRTPAPGGTTPGTPAPGGTTPGTPAPGGTTPAPGAPTPGTPAPGGTTPGTPAPGGTTPGTPAPDRPSPEGTGPGSGTPGTTTYPEVGAFRVTSLSPNRVATAGGTLVTITGLALPSNPVVRIGATATAAVVQSSTTRLVVRVPARVAGSYDVTVAARDGRSVVLRNALAYADEAGAGPGSPEGASPGGSGPGGSAPGGTPAPGGSTPPGSTPAPGGSTPGGTPAPSDAPGVRGGPSGERLVRSDRFAGLGGIWSVDCSASCTGVAL